MVASINSNRRSRDLLMLFISTLIFFGSVAKAVPLNAGMYECYCAKCAPVNFICRNRVYSCNCTDCSCYFSKEYASTNPVRYNGKIINKALG